MCRGQPRAADCGGSARGARARRGVLRVAELAHLEEGGRQVQVGLRHQRAHLLCVKIGSHYSVDYLKS